MHFEAEVRAKEMKKLHEKIRSNIEKANATYKAKANKHRKKLEFNPGDLVWLHLRKERFPSKRKNKLMSRSDGPFQVIERIGDNAYKLQLPGDMTVSATFNVGDLSPYIEDTFEDSLDLRPNPSEEEEVDAGHTTPTGSLNPNQEQGEDKEQSSQEEELSLAQIQSLFSCTRPDICTVLDSLVLGVSKASYGQVLLCWTP